MIDTDNYEGHIENIGRWQMFANTLPRWAEDADRKLVQDAPLLLAEVKRLRMIVAKLEDARIESASMFDRPALFDAVREIYEQRLQDIHQEKREEE